MLVSRGNPAQNPSNKIIYNLGGMYYENNYD